MKLSITIITFNEERNILNAIKSAGFADEIVVVDSFSTDKTKEIALSQGVKFFSNAFIGYGQQKNFAANQCSGDWIMNIDADEVISSELKNSILSVISNTNPNNHLFLFKVKRLNFVCNQPIYHGGWYPDYNIRLCKKNYAIWTEPFIHEVLKYSPDLKNYHQLKIGKLEGHLKHYTFHTIQDQIKTNFKYAELGSKKLKKHPPSFLKVLGKSFFKFIECYFLKRGFLDGKIGLIISLNASYSMFMKYIIAHLENVNLKNDKE